jgi:Skp family chaperone for outer membrane proteins
MSRSLDMSEAGGASEGASSAVAALQRTHESLATIRDRLAPFLQLASSTEAEADERALAQAAIALSIATLRVVGYRLRGQDRGKAPDDPLRQELNRIRAALQEANAKCKAKQKERDEGSAPEPSSAARSSAVQPLRSDASQLPTTPSYDSTASNKRKQNDDESSVGDRGGETSPPSKRDPLSASKKPRTG